VKTRAVITLILGACLAPLGQAAHATGQLDTLLGCRGIADTQERLQCFDRESALLAAAPRAAAPATKLADPKKEFGLPEMNIAKQEVAAGTRAADAQKIEAHVTSYTFTADRPALIRLDNDQLWRQVSAGDGDLLLKPGDAVVISRGALYSYWLQAKSGRGGKVSRVR
jgi:hypothetical protein